MEKITTGVMGLFWTLELGDGQKITIGFSQDQRWEVMFRLVVPLMTRKEVKEWQLWPYGMCGTLKAELQGETVCLSVDYLGWLIDKQEKYRGQRARRLFEGEIALKELEEAALKIAKGG